MDNNMYTTKDDQQNKKNSMYMTIMTWTAVIIAIAFVFTAIMMVKSQLAENKQAIYDNTHRIEELKHCIDTGMKPCTLQGEKN